MEPPSNRVEELIRQLEHPDWLKREAACKALGELGDARAVEPLLARLYDEQEAVRRAVVDAWRAMGQTAVEQLLTLAARIPPYGWGAADEALKRLGEDRLAQVLGDLRRGAVGEESLQEIARLREEGDLRIIEPLLCLLENWRVCEAARQALAGMGPAAVAPVITRLGHPDHSVRSAAREVLVSIGPAALEPVIGCLTDPSALVRATASATLGRLGDARAAEALMARLNDPDKEVRQGACWALGQLGDTRAMEPLIARLNDPDQQVAGNACRALGQLGDAGAVEALLAVVNRPERVAGWIVCEALGKLGDPRAVEPLIGRLEDADRSARSAACVSLGSLGDARAVEPLIARLEDPDKYVRRAACAALARFGGARAVEPLLLRLGDRESDVRSSAGEALVAIGAPAVGPLWARLRDPNQDVRRTTCYLLEKLGLGDLAKTVLRLSDRRLQVREAVCTKLGKLGDVRAVEPLLLRLGDEDRGVRRAACEALGKLRDARAVEPVAACLCDSESDVRLAAAGALGSLGQERFATAIVGAWEGKEESFQELARLAAQGDLRGVDPLAARLQDPKAELRRAAVEALKRISRVLKPMSGELLCGSCLTRFEERKSPGGASWFACRVCGKAGQALAGIRQVVAVLDEGWNQDLDGRQGALRVNWLKRRAPFDFDRVEVIRASDYEVERLCIVVGNDTDDRRNAAYKTMECAVALDSGVSEGTVGTLRTMFGKVPA